jgi:hypothetical protein
VAQFDWFLFLEALKRIAALISAETNSVNAISLLLESVEANYPAR